MTSENWEKLQIEILITQREGMIAENKQREIAGQSLAYTENEFWAIQNQLIEIGRRL